MKRKKLNDLLGIALLLIGIFIFSISLGELSLIKYVGLVGSTILIAIELVFLYQTWVK